MATVEAGRRAVYAAAERARGDEDAWRAVHAVLDASITALEELLRESPDLRRTVRLTVEDLWQLAEPALNAALPTKIEDMAALQRARWARAADAIAAYRETGDPAIRDRLAAIPDELDAGVTALQGHASERRVRMWRLAAEEIRALVTEALAESERQDR